jgi:Protein of unknown function (DUF2934)
MHASNTRGGPLGHLELDQEESMTTPKPKNATAKPAKPAKPTAERTRPTKRETALPTPDRGEIAQRAYFIHLDAGESDQLANWLQAERELTAV